MNEDNDINQSETAAEAPKENKSIVKNRAKYKGGNNGDELAVAMEKFTKKDGKVNPENLAKLFSDNNVDQSKYATKNIGMQRMTVGNILRARHNKGEAVKIGDETIAGKAAA